MMELDELKKLLDILKDTDITDIQIEKEGVKVRVKREKFFTSLDMAPGLASAPSVRSLASAASAPQQEVPGVDEDSQRLVTVTAPLVGTFYRAASPEADSYVEPGDRVKKGQVLCIVEAMKLMNEIESDIEGTVVRILVENAQSVEYGEPLFLIEPA
jgi:acetyl-CoA carboxylase biotin carboxyl carrier protein